MQGARNQLAEELGREPTEAELGKKLGLGPGALNQLLWEIDAHPILSLDECFSPEEQEGEALKDKLPETREEDPLGQLIRSDAMEAMTKGLDMLPEKQRLVLTLYYYEELTMKEVAQVLEVSESRVSQIHAQALRALKSLLRERAGMGPGSARF